MGRLHEKSFTLLQQHSGYHGYWAKNFYRINPHFGTDDDLKELSAELKKRSMFLMVDVVANHAGAAVTKDLSNVGMISPFNSAESYHGYCDITNWDDEGNVENCWLAGLPDLKQEDQWVCLFRRRRR